MRALSPPGWARGKGYSHGVEAEGRLVFVSGQVGWDEEMKFRSRDFAAQLRQALRNTVAVLAEAGARVAANLVVINLTMREEDERVHRALWLADAASRAAHRAVAATS